MKNADLSYWDEELETDILLPKKKKKKKKKDRDDGIDMFDDDSEDDERLPLSDEYLTHMASILEQFLQLIKTYFIYTDLSKEEYIAAKKRVKKAITRMKKGSTKDFDYERTMEAIVNGDIPEKYIDGGE